MYSLLADVDTAVARLQLQGHRGIVADLPLEPALVRLARLLHVERSLDLAVGRTRVQVEVTVGRQDDQDRAVARVQHVLALTQRALTADGAVRRAGVHHRAAGRDGDG